MNHYSVFCPAQRAVLHGDQIGRCRRGEQGDSRWASAGFSLAVAVEWKVGGSPGHSSQHGRPLRDGLGCLIYVAHRGELGDPRVHVPTGRPPRWWQR